MSKRGAPGIVQTLAARSSTAKRISNGLVPIVEAKDRHRFFGVVWYVVNILLILAILLVAYSAVWEYSTRRYLKGFSDAIVPASSSNEEKIEAILLWMSHGPGRIETTSATISSDRDPINTLNYAALLRVCGSATNAFINLADSTGLRARRLLLLDSRQMTKHVVAEVLIDGHWIVVDPAFRAILRRNDGSSLTREELADPVVLSAATKDIRGYRSDYTFDRTAHVRMARLTFVGPLLRGVLNRLLPSWQDSIALSLFLERESLTAVVLALILVVLFGFLRVVLRWYGEKHLGVRPIRIREQFQRACHAFLESAG
jgi:hypothetical protein